MTQRFEDNSVSIGRTPLVRLNRVVDGADTVILEKLDIEPATSPVLTQMREGEALKPAPNNVQGVGAGFAPDVLDLSLVDDVRQVTKEGAILYEPWLTREKGVLSGFSCPAAAAAAVRLAHPPENAGKTIAVILPGSSELYLSSVLVERMFDALGLAA
ncbi:MAG: hypothetical protein JOY71_11845 [Acetobacteraceae bacterium]|nr:hypothetical protein [Acetobacteraceae bacterium]